MEEVKVIEIRPLKDRRPLRAFADVRVGSVVIRDFRVMKENGKRLYVKVPFSTYKDQTGQLRFRPIVVLPDEVRGEIDLAILNAYQGEMERINAKEKR
jgi:DNA-binding cell septation regulator SpoVG